jgi:nitrate reductase NapE component
MKSQIQATNMLSRKRRFLVWAVALWAVVAGCLVTDFFVCPWTAVFP